MFQYIYNFLLDSNKNDPIFNTIKQRIAVSKIENFPLKFNFSTSIIKPRKIILGDISHRIHPIAGQGWNMTVRDIKQLYDLYKSKKKYGP